SVQWKGKIPAGQTYTKPIIQLDILPTVMAAVGGKVETDWKLDGVNLLPFVIGEDKGKPHETLYWRFGEQWAIRHGDYKLLVARGSGAQPSLFQLSDDIAEAKNLAAAQPDKVKELEKLYAAWNAEQAPPSSPKELPA